MTINKEPYTSLPLPPYSLAGRHKEIAAAIETLIDVLDLIDGDPDVELNGDEHDSDGDEKGDQAWIEWGAMRGSQKGGPNILAGHEDDEDDDPGEEDDPSGQADEDGINTAYDLIRYTEGASGPGCTISDPGGGNVTDECHDPDEGV